LGHGAPPSCKPFELRYAALTLMNIEKGFHLIKKNNLVSCPRTEPRIYSMPTCCFTTELSQHSSKLHKNAFINICL